MYCMSKISFYTVIIIWKFDKTIHFIASYISMKIVFTIFSIIFLGESIEVWLIPFRIWIYFHSRWFGAHFSSPGSIFGQKSHPKISQTWKLHQACSINWLPKFHHVQIMKFSFQTKPIKAMIMIMIIYIIMIMMTMRSRA